MSDNEFSENMVVCAVGNLSPVIQLANLGVVQCPACGRFDNDFKIRGGLCLDCFALMMNKCLKQREERKINEAINA